MIHQDDWAVVLRWPRLTTVLEVLIVIAVAAGLIFLAVAGFNYLSRRKLSRRYVLLAPPLGAAVVGALAAGLSVQHRSWQAACWRLGSEGVPLSERERCARLPPQGNEGYY